MRNILRLFSLVTLIFCSILVYADDFVAQESSVSSYWQTIDDSTHNARSIIHICASDNGSLLFGRIIQVNYDQKKNEGPEDKCDHCDKKDPRYGQPILGMVFLTGMHSSSEESKAWHDGRILDPENGKVYDANMMLDDDNQHLKVRGYIGIPLLGRTQIWQRINPEDLAKLLGNPVKFQSHHNYFETTNGKFVAQDYASCDAIQKEEK